MHAAQDESREKEENGGERAVKTDRSKDFGKQLNRKSTLSVGKNVHKLSSYLLYRSRRRQGRARARLRRTTTIAKGKLT